MTNVIESDRYREEEERLVADPGIIAMAEELIENGMAEEYLADPDSYGAAQFEAHRRGIPFDSIGGPDRAIRRILGERAS